MPYQTVGNLTLRFPRPSVSEYRRELDLTTAITRVEYTADGVRHTREVFASVPDQVIVVRLTADKPGQVSFTAAFDSPQKSSRLGPDPDTIALNGVSGDAEGHPRRVKFQALARSCRKGAMSRPSDGI